MNEAEVRKIVESVILHMEGETPERKQKGVFATMEEALEAVQKRIGNSAAIIWSSGKK